MKQVANAIIDSNKPIVGFIDDKGYWKAYVGEYLAWGQFDDQQDIPTPEPPVTPEPPTTDEPTTDEPIVTPTPPPTPTYKKIWYRVKSDISMNNKGGYPPSSYPFAYLTLKVVGTRGETGYIHIGNGKLTASMGTKVYGGITASYSNWTRTSLEEFAEINNAVADTPRYAQADVLGEIQEGEGLVVYNANHIKVRIMTIKTIEVVGIRGNSSKITVPKTEYVTEKPYWDWTL